MPRLFTALEIPAGIRDRLSALRGGLPGARWIDPADYHLTLRFFGDIDTRLARELDSELAEIEAAPLTIAISGLDVFGGARPHAVFAAVTPGRALSDLQADHERAARRAGLPGEKRKFTPHVTLAHLRGASVLDTADYLATRGGFPALSFTAGRFALFSARDLVGGGPYVAEATYPLDRAPRPGGQESA